MSSSSSQAGFARGRWFHVLAIAASQGIRALGPIVTLPIIARLSSQFEFGQFAFFLSLAQALSLAIDYGFALSGYALLSGDERANRRTFVQVLAVKLLVGAIATALVVGITLLFFPGDAGYALAASLYATALGLSPLWLLNHQRQSIRMVAFEALPVVAMFIGAALLLVYPIPLPLILGLAAVVGLLGPLTLAIGAARMAELRPSAIVAATMPHGVVQQFRLMGGRLLAMVYTVAIIPLAAAFSYSFEEIAHYAACEKLASVAGLVGIVAAQHLAPQFAAARSENVGQLARRALSMHAVLAAAIVLVLGFFGADLVELLYGPDYAGLDAGAWLLVAAGGVSYVTTVAWSGIMVPNRRGRHFAVASAAGAVAALALLLLPAGGSYVWLALARCSAEVCVLLLSLVAMRTLLRPASAA